DTRALPVLAFAADGKTLFVVGYNMIHHVDATTGESLRQVPYETRDSVVHAIAPNGETLASVGTDKTLRFWNAATGEERHRTPALENANSVLRFSLDSRSLFSATGERTQDCVVRVWDVATGKEQRKLVIPGKEKEKWLRPMAFSPDGGMLALEQ